MSATDHYIASIVEKYDVDSEVGSAAHRAADELLPIIKRWSKQHLLGITAFQCMRQEQRCYTFNSTTVAPPPPSFCGASTTEVT